MDSEFLLFGDYRVGSHASLSFRERERNIKRESERERETKRERARMVCNRIKYSPEKEGNV